MEVKVQVVSIAASLLLLVAVLELVRSRRLLERYAILWLLSATVLLALAIWKDLLSALAKTIGVHSPPNALFLIAFGFVLVLLLHFSLAVSRLSDRSKMLAQRLALLEKRQTDTEQRLAGAEQDGRELEHAGTRG